jgi:hypothetical protein
MLSTVALTNSVLGRRREHPPPSAEGAPMRADLASDLSGGMDVTTSEKSLAMRVSRGSTIRCPRNSSEVIGRYSVENMRHNGRAVNVLPMYSSEKISEKDSCACTPIMRERVLYLDALPTLMFEWTQSLSLIADFPPTTTLYTGKGIGIGKGDRRANKYAKRIPKVRLTPSLMDEFGHHRRSITSPQSFMRLVIACETMCLVVPSVATPVRESSGRTPRMESRINDRVPSAFPKMREERRGGGEYIREGKISSTMKWRMGEALFLELAIIEATKQRSRGVAAE